jgi:hypothetical protein
MWIVAALIFVVACVVVAIVAVIAMRKRQKPPKKSGATQSHSCGDIDPVMDPVYNMKEIVKQSIVLEEHINHERKRCKDCITKHFLHIVGLAEEAVSLDPDTPI